MKMMKMMNSSPKVKQKNHSVKGKFDGKMIGRTFSGLTKVFKSEFKAQFSIAIIIGIIITTILPLLNPIVSGSLEGDKTKTYIQISQMMGQTVIYALIIRVVMIFREKTSVDRNRALYLRHGKNTVLFGKTIVEAMIFIVSVFLVAIVGTVLTVNKNKGSLPDGFIGNLVAYVFAILFLYGVMATGIKWALSSVNKKEFKGIIIGAFLVLTAGVYTVMGITEPLVKSGNDYVIMDLIEKNKYVFSFVPILNIAVIPMTITNRLDGWTVVPFIVEAMIVIGIMWRPLAKNLKFYLAG